MLKNIFTHRHLWRQKEFFLSLLPGIVLVFLSLFVNTLTGIYVNASNAIAVNDIFWTIFR